MLDQLSSHASSHSARRPTRRSGGRRPSFERKSSNPRLYRRPSISRSSSIRKNLQIGSDKDYGLDGSDTVHTTGSDSSDSSMGFDDSSGNNKKSIYTIKPAEEPPQTRFVATCSSAVEKRLASRGLAVPGVQVEVIPPKKAPPKFRRTPSRREVLPQGNAATTTAGGGARPHTQRRASIGACHMTSVASSGSQTITSPSPSPIANTTARPRIARRLSVGGSYGAPMAVTNIDTMIQRPRPVRRQSMGAAAAALPSARRCSRDGDDEEAFPCHNNSIGGHNGYQYNDYDNTNGDGNDYGYGYDTQYDATDYGYDMEANENPETAAADGRILKKATRTDLPAAPSTSIPTKSGRSRKTRVSRRASLGGGGASNHESSSAAPRIASPRTSMITRLD